MIEDIEYEIPETDKMFFQKTRLRGPLYRLSIPVRFAIWWHERIAIRMLLGFAVSAVFWFHWMDANLAYMLSIATMPVPTWGMSWVVRRYVAATL